MHNLHPGLVLMATGMLVLVLPEKARKWIALLGAAASLGAALLLKSSASMSFQFTATIAMELLQVDALSRFFGLIFCVMALLGGLYAFSLQGRGEKGVSLIYAGSSICVIFAGDLISLLCFWEIMAVASCCLVFWGTGAQARQASFRYLLMHFFGGNLLLAGIVMLVAEGTRQIGLPGATDSWAFGLLLAGVAVNAAIPPFHTWVPDAYPQSSPAATVYLGSYTTKAAIYVLIRFFAGMEQLVMVGALMAVFGVCMALLENNLRRLLSYHIVSQLGMMIAALGTGLDTGIDGAALHAAFNILYKGVLFMGAGAVLIVTGTEKITQLGGLYRRMPVTAVCFFISSLAIAGLPPLNGFISKGLIMEALREGGYTAAYWLIMLAGVGTWLSVTLKINWFVFFGKEACAEGRRKGLTSGSTDPEGTCPRELPSMQAAMIVGTFLCILTGVLDNWIYSFLPRESVGHPYTVVHVMEYLALFAGATAAFFLMRKKMEPHDLLILDFDWFYRMPLAKAVRWISQVVVWIFRRFEISAENFVWVAKVLPNSPDQILRTFEKWHREEDHMPVGQFMQMFIIFCIIAFVFILIIE